MKVVQELAGGQLSARLHELHPRWSFDQLCGFGSRHNAKRAFLFVSKVLGKHIPVAPKIMAQTHKDLADALQPWLQKAKSVAFVGFAETATGLGTGVFEACLEHTLPNKAMLTLTTRYHFSQEVALDFQEEHSHATGHLVYWPTQGREIFEAADSVVLIDDEYSTGKTAINFLKELTKLNANIRRVALVSLLSWISDEQKAALQAAVPGIEVSHVCLARGDFEFEPRPGYACPPAPSAVGNGKLKDQFVKKSHGRFGETAAMTISAERVSEIIRDASLDLLRPVHVVGDGECMHAAFVLAKALESRGYSAYVQSTTRSPVQEGLAIRSKQGFVDHYGDGIVNYCYNLPDASAQLLLVHESSGPLTLTGARRMYRIPLWTLT